MARVFTTGAEMGDVLFWDVPGSCTNVTTSPRSGSRCFALVSNSTVQKNITALSEAYFRWGINTNSTTNNRYLTWRSGATELGSIRKNITTQKLEIYTGTATLQATGTLALQINTWYLIEVHIKIADAGGVITVRIDGSQDVTFSGDTQPGSDTTIDNVTTVSANGVTIFLDDLALNDTTTANDNSWCGDGKIVMLSPTSAGDVTQLTPSAGANWQCVDDVPPNTTDYVSSATAGQYDLYNCGTVALAAGEVVTRVQVEARALETSATGDSIGLAVKTEAVEYFDSGHVVTTAYARYVGNDLRTNPNTGVAWTQAELDALQVGVKVI